MTRVYIFTVMVASIAFGVIGYVAFDARSDNGDQSRDLASSICSTANQTALAFREPQGSESDHHFEQRLRAQRRSLRASLSLHCDIPGFAAARTRALAQIDQLLTTRRHAEQNGPTQQSNGGSDEPADPSDQESAPDAAPPAALGASDAGAGSSGGNGGGSAPGGSDDPQGPPPPPTTPTPPTDPGDPAPPSLGDQVGGLVDGVTGTACGATGELGVHIGGLCP